MSILTKYSSSSFSAKYNAEKLVYYKLYDTIVEAITEEKRIKGGNRFAKIRLIESINRNGLTYGLKTFVNGDSLCKYEIASPGSP